jgi:hypothetical protein
MSINWSDEQLAAVGIDKKRLISLIRRLRRCSKDLEAMNFKIYGESGRGLLIHDSRPDHDDQSRADYGSVVADVGYGFDGGGW